MCFDNYHMIIIMIHRQYGALSASYQYPVNSPPVNSSPVNSRRSHTLKVA